jgi:tetratricopeptide (TPR) repeat protein
MDPASPSRRFGPPQYLARLRTTGGTGTSEDGRVFAIPLFDRGALVVHVDHPERQVILSPQKDVRFCAVSPNGRWVATGSHWGTAPTVKVWDADTGKLEKELPVEGSSTVGFSPDGCWLATTGGGCRLWRVDSWEEGPRIGGGAFAFSPDGKVLALQEGFGRVRLVDPNTGKEYARLEVPVQSRLYPQCFTPDGARLITWAQDALALQIWDLRAIGQQLADIGLDWDLPYEPANDTKPAPPLQIRLEVGNSFEFLAGGDDTSVGLDSLLLALNPFNFEAYLRRGRVYGRLATSQRAMGASRKAIPEYSMALALMPPAHRDRGEALFRRSNNYRLLNDLPKAEPDLQTIAEHDLDLPPELHSAAAEQCHNLARRFVTDPEPQRQPNLALPLVRKAVKLMPDQWRYWNTLGMVYYRLGQYAEAMEKLQHSLDLSKGKRAAYNLFYIAMCHTRQGDAAQAKACYDRAKQWLQEHQDGRLSKEEGVELTRLRAEADEVLGLPSATTR